MQTDIIDRIGYHGPNILGVVSLYLLLSRNQFPYLISYCVGYLLNIKINEILKTYIKEPRPKGCKEDFKRGTPHYYGMPSGHAQMCFFSVIYIYLITKDIILLIWMLALAFTTLFQRYTTKCHSPLQLLAGSITGGVVSTIVFFATKYLLLL